MNNSFVPPEWEFIRFSPEDDIIAASDGTMAFVQTIEKTAFGDGA